MVEESVEARLSESTVAPRDLLSAPVEIRKSQYRSMFTI